MSAGFWVGGDPPGAACSPDADRSGQEHTITAFGQRLRELRTKHGLSQDDLARRTGIHPTAIGRFEHGKREPRLMSILNLARGLKVAPGELLNTLPGAENWHDIGPQGRRRGVMA